MQRPTVYIAAGLFEGADLEYNERLAEKVGAFAGTILPQRDGFESSRLHELLIREGFDFPENENVANRMIYLLDKGWFIGAKSSAVLARLDGLSFDPGVVSEIGIARELGIPVFSFRTDVRSPYGSGENEAGGAHFFPVYDSDFFRKFSGDVELGTVVDWFSKGLDSLSGDVRTNHTGSKRTQNVLASARLLFGNSGDIHSVEGLANVIRRYNLNKSVINSCFPNFEIVV